MLPSSALVDVLFREGHYLDSWNWQAWLDLYTEDAVFWLPAWRSEDQLCSSPDSELSLIYYESRGGLADRVWRATSGLSVASTPMPRTTHTVSNVILREPSTDNEAKLAASWTTHVYDPKTHRAQTFHGLYEHDLRRDADEWRINRKKIVLMNDRIPTSLDFYCL
ncbi:MAG TPA: aromatic-ring-hydroxylating dioxygenase subunit beta [Phenylobacterium sp.]|nr:aromatic-ring-hydroxylating dioxygenase subunit beta [Phenylobacterium sp.]